jgi:hypothetical protein
LLLTGKIDSTSLVGNIFSAMRLRIWAASHLNYYQSPLVSNADHFVMRDAMIFRCGYSLFLMHLPENQDHTNGWMDGVGPYFRCS